LGPAPAPLERPDALSRLARRYLAGHGPADARDLAKWAKLTLGDARAALDGIVDEVVQRPDGLVDLPRKKTPAPTPGPRLLGPFDPLLLGWNSREQFVGAHRGIVTTNGLFRPFALVNGRAVALWRLSGRTLTIQPLERVKKSVIDALRADGRAVFDYLGIKGVFAVVVDA
jgi:hypothetical protein